ncbi:adenosylmethionine--8-amino-7-oxononanoate transaminase [Solitalea canadensis]|uniref:Adenosylmethionine-8-amino-7-oxononanoate aminotransferase n=1 Tax=Solitalea canadensis (strain ATCC 29591 / DSM 3403 / JCM 21819 / LMG 8368 / NBRC 15130 / NCIMB 12057 / USAM 9D) TaxID=929556 RepID=H8KQY6_SOLCM|nr:adenosylmethionine--8-amino-7-oxononanoate transaminase [Solitalea canadensis]AFD07132.1 adenosylmethionine-8-amino-7-oxononanoate transaminase [Solitalea canadensis DSM 3403]
MNLVKRDLKAIWHPYTQMKTASAPIPIVRGEGLYLIDEHGNRYMDVVASWWVNIHGHSHSYIAQKVSEQLHTLEHVIFAGFTHPTAVELAERLLAIIPDNQQKIFYSDNGSTAVEVALKMAFQYWHNSGISKKKVLAFNNSYHGDTFGAMSVSARSAFTNAFESLLFDVEYIDLPTPENLSNLKSHISNLSDHISSFIFEPLVQGAGGMIMYEAAPLDELIRFCKEQNILVIADEVMTGFGRTGKLFACNYLTEQPDMICFSKGLTGGTMPLGITSCSQAIYDRFLSDDKLKTLFHGHSFTANPVACAASLASLDLLLKEETMKQIEMICEKHSVFKNKIVGHAKLFDIRQQGTILAMEWNYGENTSYFNEVRDKLYNFFLENKIIMRPMGNVLYLLPPYCITTAELDFVYGKIEEALEKF